MAYAFEREESIPAGVRRILEERIAKAEAHLLDSGAPAEDRIHGARKRFKESRAVMLSNRMLEHLQLLKPDTLTAEALLKLNLIDSYAAGKYTFTNVPLDHGSRYSPAAALPGGSGWFSLTEVAGGSIRVDLTIAWKSNSGSTHQIQTGTIVGGYK